MDTKICKLCTEDKKPKDMSTGDTALCKTCFNDVAYYKRMCSSPPTARLKIVVAKFQASLERGGWVHPTYLVPETWQRCSTCAQNFLSKMVTSTCPQCKSDEHNYNSLLRARDIRPNVKLSEYSNHTKNNRKRRALTELEAKYMELHLMGRRVPPSFLRDRAMLR